YYFFFFQAEDGIRDFHVTGVQTCALPILHQLAIVIRSLLALRAFIRTYAGSTTIHERVRNGTQIHVLQLAAHRHTTSQTRDLQAARTQGFADHVGRGFPFGIEARCQNDLLYLTVARTFDQGGQADVTRAHPVQRAQAPEEHKVQATVAPRALEGGLIGRTLDHTEQAG